MTASIIIVTRNRAADLRQTLDSMRRVEIPAGLRVELLVVDNGSTDGTLQLISTYRLPDVDVRWVCEERRGLSHGRNRGLAESRGEFLLFTDDDIRPPADWLHAMVSPMAGGLAEAVCGGVSLSPRLLRPWMTSLHRSWLAATEWVDPLAPRHLVGANMGFVRAVLRRVPGFDPELGAGALGSGEEVLFAHQLVEAGFRIHNCLGTCVEHHFDPARLERAAWLETARKMGASQAYIGHHWEHWPCRFGRARMVREAMRLNAWRAAHGTGDCDGCSERESRLVMATALVRAHVKESRRPRNYEWHGLTKLPHS